MTDSADVLRQFDAEISNFQKRVTIAYIPFIARLQEMLHDLATLTFDSLADKRRVTQELTGALEQLGGTMKYVCPKTQTLCSLDIRPNDAEGAFRFRECVDGIMEYRSSSKQFPEGVTIATDVRRLMSA